MGSETRADSGDSTPSLAARWRGAVGKAVAAIANPVVAGLEHLPETGGFVVLSNHPTKTDRQLLQVALDRPCDLVEMSASGIDDAVRKVSAGQVVVAFAEGHRSPDGAMHRGRDEVADLVARVFAPIIPAAVCPPIERRSWLSSTPASSVEVHFGRPLDLARFRDAPMDDLARRTAVDAVTHAIVALSGRSYVDADAAERSRVVRDEAARQREARAEASRQARAGAEQARQLALQQAEDDERRAEADRQWAERAAREQAARAAQADAARRPSIRSKLD